MVKFDQKAWHASLDHPLAPIWHIQSTESALCECVRHDTADAVASIYVPALQRIALCDHIVVCDAHPFDFERGKNGLWANASYYSTPDLIRQQRAWFVWRVGMRQRLENAYCAARARSGLSPEAAYAKAIPSDLHPALEEQVPPQRLEDEYQNRVRYVLVGGAYQPWEHPIREDSTTTTEPAMPTKIEPPQGDEVAARERVRGWHIKEDRALQAARDLAKKHVPDLPDEAVAFTMTGTGDRVMHLDYRGALHGTAIDQVQSALHIQFGGAALIEG
jgi:hypothetical protein